MLRRFNNSFPAFPSSSLSLPWSSIKRCAASIMSSTLPYPFVCPAAEPSWNVVKSTKKSILVTRKKFNSEPEQQEELLELPLQWISHNSLRQRHGTGQRVETLVNQIDRNNKIQKGVVEIVSAEVVKPEVAGGQDSTPAATATATSTATSPVPTNPGTIQVKLSDGTVESISFEHLSKYAARPILIPFKSTSPPTPENPETNPRNPLNSAYMLAGAENIQRVKFLSLAPTALGTDLAAHKDKDNAMIALYRDGICIVEGCPDAPETVLRIADFFGAPAGAMSTLYGKSWLVESVPRQGPKNNIAYTAEFLDLHNDLVYYQSMPGVQLLHCMKFDSAVQGGESFFADAFVAAERLREENPVAFEVLCRVPCAFAKDDPAREIPASYYYATPHISCDMMTGVINCVRWAPAFEIPMALGGYLSHYDNSKTENSSSGSIKVKTNSATSAAQSLNSQSDIEIVNEYYEAYNEYAKLLQKIKLEQKLSFRLKPGETVVFNQARMLHGREAFVEPNQPGMRKLSGCYVNIDDFRSRCMSRFACCVPEPIRTPNWSFTNGSGR